MVSIRVRQRHNCRVIIEETNPDVNNGRPVQRDGFACSHCQRLVVEAEGDEGGFCRQCMAPVCIVCGRQERCDPFEEKLAREFARQRMLSSMGI